MYSVEFMQITIRPVQSVELEQLHCTYIVHTVGEAQKKTVEPESSKGGRGRGRSSVQTQRQGRSIRGTCTVHTFYEAHVPYVFVGVL